MIDYLQEARLNSKRKYLKETFDYIIEIGKPKKFISFSDFSPVNKVKFEVQKGERCFNFKVPYLNLVSDIAKYQRDRYGLAKPFSIQNDKIRWLVPNGVANFSMEMNDKLTTEGELWHL